MPILAGPLTRTLDWEEESWTLGEISNEYFIDNNRVAIEVQSSGNGF